MDLHNKDGTSPTHCAWLATCDRSHEQQRMAAVLQDCADGVGEDDVDSHPRHISTQDILVYGMDVVASWALACKRWDKPFTDSDLMDGLRADHLRDIRKDHAKNLGKLQ